jgi:hypothetical protein
MALLATPSGPSRALPAPQGVPPQAKQGGSVVLEMAHKGAFNHQKCGFNHEKPIKNCGISNLRI